MVNHILRLGGIIGRNKDGPDVDKVVLTGHADRIGSEDYNQQLSEERAQAVADYLAAGTHLVWVVHPTTRTVFVYRSPHNVQALGEADELSGEDVLTGFCCPVRRVFA